MVRDSKLKVFMESAEQLRHLIINPTSDDDDIQDMLDIVEDEFESLKEADSNVLVKLAGLDTTTPNDYEEEEARIRGIQRKGLVIINRAKRQLNKTGDNGATATLSPSPGFGNKKLPKIDLPKFSGEVRDWLPFWSQYKAIHENNSINDADKFQYLIQSTVDGSEAREVVMSFPVCAENYHQAVKQLKKMYGREKLLVKVYIRDLLKLVIDNAQQKKVTLSSLYFKLSAKLKALESLGVTTDKCASVIYPLVESCLPEEVLRTWQRHPTCQGAKEGEEELTKLIEFLEKEVGAESNIRLACNGLNENTETTVNKPEVNNRQQGSSKKNGSAMATAAALLSLQHNEERKSCCIFCGNDHPSELCRKASNMTLQEKDNMIKQKGACFNCLKLNYRANKCRSRVKCLICGGRHQAVMCRNLGSNMKTPPKEPTTFTPPNEDKKENNQPIVSATNTTTESGSFGNQHQFPEVLLQTLVVKVKGEKGSLRATALVDTGSHKSYILKPLAERVGLKRVGSEEVVHSLFGGTQTAPVTHVRYKIFMSDLDDKCTANFDVSDTSQISGKINMVPRGPWLRELEEKGIRISDVGEESTEIEVLIGADVAAKLLTGNMYQLQCGPVAIETRLGWTLMGKLPFRKSTANSTMMVFSMHIHDAEIAKLWELDAIGITDPSEKKTRQELEEAALQHFEDTVTVNEENRYEVHLPWIEGHATLPTNFNVTEKRLKSTTANLQGDGTLSLYDALFKSWEEMGMIEEVPDGEAKNYGHYLPHRAVYKPNSETTPIRPVFDASCRVKGQPSLNDCLEKGPNLLELIPSIVTRFRRNAVGVIADVKKAFQQISVYKKDRDFLRFLWWKSLNCDEIKIYRHKRVVFGVNSSPFILGATLNHLLERAEEDKRGTAQLLKKSLYVDNVATSVPSWKEAIQFKCESEDLLASSSFELRGWEIGPGPEEKHVPLLGLTWEKEEDYLSCDLCQIEKKNIEGPVTKRKMLSLAHSICDPIGFTAPYTIIPKQLLQETWSMKIGWDSPLPEDITKRFENWRQQLPLLRELQIPRRVTNTSNKKENWSLHVFVDASMKSYVACVYLRVQGETETSVQLLQAKARVALLKSTSIPRLELLSCGIGARLAHTVKEILEEEEIPTYYWTDSSTALYWIQHDGNWGVFVQRRVEEIKQLSKIDDWRHIPGEDNPADLPSRGGSLRKIIQSRWLEVPIWLKYDEECWPKSTVSYNEDEINEEKKKTVVTALAQYKQDCITQVEQCEEYDDMVETMHIQLKPEAGFDDLTTKEYKKAEKALLKIVQDSSFSGIQDEKLKKLNVFIDEDKLIRLKTRLLRGDFSEDFKRPIVLPHRSPVVDALIMHEHKKHCHAGVQTLLSILREQFWILKGRRTIRQVFRKCEDCMRYAAKKMDPEMAPLPKDRMQADIPFQVTGVDMMGPLFLKDGNKAWVALFTCAVYRAIHLELVTSLSTEAFKNALRLFVGRRGRPSIIYSDNGTNFVGTHNLFKAVNWKQVQKYGSYQKIEWRFNPPTAAWWGGFWERMVGVVKSTLRKVLGKASLDFEELETVLCEVEAVVNQRPLTYISEDDKDLEPLSPYLFLTGNKTADIPEADVVDAKSLKMRWRYMQRIREDLRSRFRKE
ncbi:unnamed protein product [Orchesella dallaii]|uniref:Integrase catalytic domain-containing protein n=1 Tax=Orchesella dallaii TaxID=48710 RepID=A0ABP1RLV6_9HEXA